MSQQQPSGWNSFFHRDQAYDTTYNNNNNYNNNTEEPIRFSYFQYKEEKEPYNAYEQGTRGIQGGYSDVEKATNPGDPSFWKTPGSEYIPEGGVSVMPSAPPESPQSPHGTTTFDKGGVVESDEELAKRIYREEQEQYLRYSQGSMKQPSGMSDYPTPGEAQIYYAAGNDRRDSSNVQVGETQGIPQAKPKIPKPRQLQRRAYFTYLVTLIQLAMLIYEFIYNQKVTGSPIQTQPFNPLIGPASSPTLIQLGARFVPCMKYVPTLNVNNGSAIQCNPNDPPTKTCTLEELCGLGGFKNGEPNQWVRFIIPIFLHGGIVHFLFNMLFQVQTGKQVELDMGWWRYGIIYMASGIFGFIFGGNFSEPTIPSMGASGSLFGVIGILVLDLLQNWKSIRNPCWELTKMVLMIAFTFLLGLLPAIDNFSHIGGFIMGIIMGLILMPTVNFSKNHKRFTWGLRILAIPLATVMFVLLIRNFYVVDSAKACSWCKYLNCLPISGWCDISGIQQKTINP